jgi:hypothetical protein
LNPSNSIVREEFACAGTPAFHTPCSRRRFGWAG